MKKFVIFFMVITTMGLLSSCGKWGCDSDNQKAQEDQTFPPEQTAPDQSQQAPAKVGGTVFCFIDANAQHVPAIAASAVPGYRDAYMIPNGQGKDGWNWCFANGQSVDKNVGVLDDGTIFIKEAFATGTMQATLPLMLKADKYAWQPKPGQKTTIDKEVAYVWK